MCKYCVAAVPQLFPKLFGTSKKKHESFWKKVKSSDSFYQDNIHKLLSDWRKKHVIWGRTRDNEDGDGDIEVDVDENELEEHLT